MQPVLRAVCESKALSAQYIGQGKWEVKLHLEVWLEVLKEGRWVWNYPALSEDGFCTFDENTAQVSSITQSPVDVPQPTPVTPWYENVPIVGDVIKGIGVVGSGIDWLHQNWDVPAAMTAGQIFSPQLRQQIAGRAPFSIPVSERGKIWQANQMPWLAKTTLELIVDPLILGGLVIWYIAARRKTQRKP